MLGRHCVLPRTSLYHARLLVLRDLELVDRHLATLCLTRFGSPRSCISQSRLAHRGHRAPLVRETLQLSTCRLRVALGLWLNISWTCCRRDGPVAGKGEEGPDTRRNVEVWFWVGEVVRARIGLSHTCVHSDGIIQPSDDLIPIFAEPPVFTLKDTVALVS